MDLKLRTNSDFVYSHESGFEFVQRYTGPSSVCTVADEAMAV